MIGTIFFLTIRQLCGKRRLILAIVLACIPLGLAITIQANAGSWNNSEIAEFTQSALMGIVIAVVMPFICLPNATSAIGQEIEDGTILYLLTKPISRTQIIIEKFFGATIVAAATVTTAVIISLIIVPGGYTYIVPAIATLTIGTLCYSAVFLALSTITRKSMIVGVAYVALIEIILQGFISDTSYLSISAYCFRIFELINNEGRIFTGGGIDNWYAPNTGLGVSLGVLIAVTFTSLFLSKRLLESREAPQDD